jgi:hypothetical protein
MIFLALLLVGQGSVSASRADVEVAPPPREVRPDGSRDPVPEPMPPKSQNPLETVERIIKNSKAVGDKLAMTDTGTDTRKTQDIILKDIQSLIDDQENPPSPKPDQNHDMNKDQKEENSNGKDKKNDMMPMSGNNDTQPEKKDMQPGGGMDNQPKDGNDQPKTRKPRQQGGDQSKERGNKPKNPGFAQMGEKGTGIAPSGPSQDPKQGNGMIPDPMSKTERPPTVPSLPPEEAAVKDVWGYLPDKLRQQAMQYYKQEFMPRYTKLLEHYYSSLSEKNAKK